MLKAALRICPAWLENSLAAVYFKARSFSGSHSIMAVVDDLKMQVVIIPALQDNYMYLIVDDETKEAAIVDPAEPETAAKAIKENKLKLTKILTTHHHWDHASGNEKMLKIYNNLDVYGNDDRIPGVTCKVKHGDKIKLGNLTIECLETPCHTSGHICYYVTNDDDPPAVFTGDTLFAAGCGRFFEGTADQMYKNLIEILGKLPDETRVFCGHEYTGANLRFAIHVEPENLDIIRKLAWSDAMRKESSPTIPSSIEHEKQTNPFMRVHEKTVQEHTKESDPIKVMAALRKEKDNFKTDIKYPF